jgi:hypothetical protein
MFYVPVVNGMLFLEVLELQVQYMIGFRNGGGLTYSNVCGWIDGLSVYDKKTGIDWKWRAIDGTIKKAPLGGKKYRFKFYQMSLTDIKFTFSEYGVDHGLKLVQGILSYF